MARSFRSARSAAGLAVLGAACSVPWPPRRRPGLGLRPPDPSAARPCSHPELGNPPPRPIPSTPPTLWPSRQRWIAAATSVVWWVAWWAVAWGTRRLLATMAAAGRCRWVPCSDPRWAARWVRVGDPPSGEGNGSVSAIRQSPDCQVRNPPAGGSRFHPLRPAVPDTAPLAAGHSPRGGARAGHAEAERLRRAAPGCCWGQPRSGEVLPVPSAPRG